MQQKNKNKLKKIIPDYKRIFSDILETRYPENKVLCLPILSKEELSQLDVIELNRIIFWKKNKGVFKQIHKSYDRSSIIKMLVYQKEFKLSNRQLAQHFQLSRNTVAKWKKIFIV